MFECALCLAPAPFAPGRIPFSLARVSSPLSSVRYQSFASPPIPFVVLFVIYMRRNAKRETRITGEQMLLAMQVRARVARQMMRTFATASLRTGPVPVSPLAPEFFCSACSGCFFDAARSMKHSGCSVRFKEERRQINSIKVSSNRNIILCARISLFVFLIFCFLSSAFK